jgi:hypothetical protein
MDFSSPQLAAAAVAGIVALVTACATAVVTIALAERKMRRDFRLDFAAERVAHELMLTKWRLRSFALIKSHLSGFEDNELRRILVKAGAIRFTSKSGFELWGLLDRNRYLLGMHRVPWDPENRPTEWDKPPTEEERRSA